MRNSVSRPDDLVHSFFAARAAKLVELLFSAEFVAGLRRFIRPGHRERRFTLPTLLWLGMFGAAHAVERSMEVLLAKARDVLEGARSLPLHGVTLTQSGWSRAKEGLPLGLLKRVWRRWVETARHHAGDAAWFHGMRVVALDNKAMHVPEALWPVFGAHRGSRGHGPAQGELLVAYDVFARVPLEFTVGKVCADERVLAFRFVRKLESPSLWLIDSGFYSMALFADLQGAGHHFLTRMKANGKPKLLRRLGPGDGIYEIHASESYWRTKGHSVPLTMEVRIVQAHWKGFRPVRLVTSLLDAQAVPPADIIELYHRRWHVETFFRELAHSVNFEHWHTRKLKGLYVELLFYMIYVSAVRAQMAEAARAAGVRPETLSFGRGTHACIRAWTRMAKCPAPRCQAIYQELLAHLATLQIDIRPGRRFERNTQRRRAKSRIKKLQALKAKRHAA